MSESPPQPKLTSLSRRAALRTLASGTTVAASAVLAPALFVEGNQAELAKPNTPAEALARLVQGNQRFAAGHTIDSNRDLKRVRQIAEKQTPFAAFLGCADSRVPIEMVFDQGLGDLFVTRIAGNVVTSEILGSLEFGTRVLGAKVLYVLGHSACGAVTATLQRDEVPGQISSLFQHIRPAVKTSGGNVDRAIIDNVRNQAQILAEASPVIARLMRDGELIVAGGVYDLTTGRVQPVEIAES